MSSKNMVDQFKTIEDLSAFAKAQQKTLIELTKKNKNYEEEIKHLKKLVEGAVPLISNKPKVDFSTSDEESIAREQLFRLKELSRERELNLEETKRYEIYSKMLSNLKEKPKDINAKSKDVDDAVLIALLPGKGNDDSTSR